MRTISSSLSFFHFSSLSTVGSSAEVFVLGTELVDGSDDAFLVFASIGNIFTFDQTLVDPFVASIGFPAGHVNKFEIVPAFFVHETVSCAFRRDDGLGCAFFDPFKPCQDRRWNC